MPRRKLKLQDKIWKDKRIKHEGKIIYAYILSKGINNYVTHLSIFELQPVISITIKGLNKNLEKLESCQYLKYKNYDKGLYEIKLN